MSLKSASALLSSVSPGTVPNSSENQFCHLQNRGNNIHLSDQELNTMKGTNLEVTIFYWHNCFFFTYAVIMITYFLRG